MGIQTSEGDIIIHMFCGINFKTARGRTNHFIIISVRRTHKENGAPHNSKPHEIIKLYKTVLRFECA